MELQKGLLVLENWEEMKQKQKTKGKEEDTRHRAEKTTHPLVSERKGFGEKKTSSRIVGSVKKE